MIYNRDHFLDIKNVSFLKNIKFELSYNNRVNGMYNLKKLNDHGCCIYSINIQGDGLSKVIGNNGDIWKFVNIFRELSSHPIEKVVIRNLNINIRAFRFVMKFICEYVCLKKLIIKNLMISGLIENDPILFENFSYLGQVSEVKLEIDRRTNMGSDFEYISKIVLNKSLEQSLNTLTISSNFDVYIDTMGIKDLTYVFIDGISNKNIISKFECLERVKIEWCNLDTDMSCLLNPKLKEVNFHACSSYTATSFLTKCIENGRNLEKLSLIVNFSNLDLLKITSLMNTSSSCIKELVFSDFKTNTDFSVCERFIDCIKGLKKLTVGGSGLFLFTENTKNLESINIQGYILEMDPFLNNICQLLNIDNNLKELTIGHGIFLLNELDVYRLEKMEKLNLLLIQSMEMEKDDFMYIMTKIFSIPNLTDLRISMDGFYSTIDQVMIILNFVKKSKKLKKLAIKNAKITMNMIKDIVDNGGINSFNFSGSIINYTHDSIINIFNNTLNGIQHLEIIDNGSDSIISRIISQFVSMENNMRRDRTLQICNMPLDIEFVVCKYMFG